MPEYFTSIKHSFLSFTYKFFFKPIFFSLDPEFVHDTTVFLGNCLGKTLLTRKITSLLFNYSHPSLEQTIFGIKFKNPVGLAAGFDKDAKLIDIIPEIGFGFEEIGSITAKPYEGNPKPRLTRLKKSQSILVNYGLKSQGAKAIAKKLSGKKFKFPVGTSIAKTNSIETVDIKKGIEDYVEGFKYFTEIGDYYTINISCPNTFGGQPFHIPKLLKRLLTQIDEILTQKPVFIKFSPDLSLSEVDKILGVTENHRIAGIIMGNLSKNRTSEKVRDKNLSEEGGMSGKVVEDLSNALIAHIYKKTGGRYIIIGCGGVFNAEDAYKKIKLGASLIQLITGMIYQGPQTISQINSGLVRLLKADGYGNISEAVGTDIR